MSSASVVLACLPPSSIERCIVCECLFAVTPVAAAFTYRVEAKGLDACELGELGVLQNSARDTGEDEMALCMQGDVVARRARYEAKWASFVASTQPGITHAQVPWLGENAADIQVASLNVGHL